MRSIAQVDFAVRDTRTLARSASRALRSGATGPQRLAAAVDVLAEAVWSLAAAYDEPGRTQEVRRLAMQAAELATRVHAPGTELAVSELIVQVRSTAIDLVRAAELVAGEPVGAQSATDELLLPDRERG